MNILFLQYVKYVILQIKDLICRVKHFSNSFFHYQIIKLNLVRTSSCKYNVLWGETDTVNTKQTTTLTLKCIYKVKSSLYYYEFFLLYDARYHKYNDKFQEKLIFFYYFISFIFIFVYVVNSCLIQFILEFTTIEINIHNNT